MVRVSEVDPAFRSVPPAGTEVTVYPLMADPPLLAGAANETVALALPAVATTEVGPLRAIPGATA